MKKSLWILIGVGSILPLILNIIVVQSPPRWITIAGDEATWLSFWPVYLSAIASFAMVLVAYFTLKQNKNQLDELRRQWNEANTPKITACFVTGDNSQFLRVQNISNVVAKDVNVTIVDDPPEETRKEIYKYDELKEYLNNMKFNIQPTDFIDIIMVRQVFYSGIYPGSIKVKIACMGKTDTYELFFQHSPFVVTKSKDHPLKNSINRYTEALNNRAK